MLKQIDFHIIVGCCLWKVWTKSGKVMTTETALLADKTGAGFVFWARGPMGRRARLQQPRPYGLPTRGPPASGGLPINFYYFSTQFEVLVNGLFCPFFGFTWSISA